MGASVYANMLKMYSYLTNYFILSDRNVQAETGFYIQNFIVVLMKRNECINVKQQIKQSVIVTDPGRVWCVIQFLESFLFTLKWQVKLTLIAYYLSLNFSFYKYRNARMISSASSNRRYFVCEAAFIIVI